MKKKDFKSTILAFHWPRWWVFFFWGVVIPLGAMRLMLRMRIRVFLFGTHGWYLSEYPIVKMLWWCDNPMKKWQVLHPRKLTCPPKRDYFSREYIFQPLIFRGHVSFPGCTLLFFHIPRGLSRPVLILEWSMERLFFLPFFFGNYRDLP